MVAPRALDIYESFDRFAYGKKVREDTWDYVTIPTNALAMKEKYNIVFDGKVIPEDEDLADRLFLAGVDMLACTGFYNTNLGRVLSISEEEIYEGLKKAPKKIKMGRGNDRVSCKARKGNSKRKPIIQGGPTGAPVSEEIFPNMMQSYAQETAVDTLVSGILNTVSGRPSTTN
ncbi:MAG: monomethylamine:corrinoid methyltransferase, partial [Methanomassiliicoccaceae archaeon]|nr:monomethylamine:corrinoid methyltransferase [Methanomassiliicoccaceae archaeon]